MNAKINFLGSEKFVLLLFFFFFNYKKICPFTDLADQRLRIRKREIFFNKKRGKLIASIYMKFTFLSDFDLVNNLKLV